MRNHHGKCDIVAVIFARGGSKGIPQKNLKNFCGKPLIGWAIEQVIASGVARRVIVSTDDVSIASVAKSFGADVPFMRPANLATDDSPELLSWRHALDFIYDDEGEYPSALLSVPTTSPLRLPDDIRRAVTLFTQSQCDLVVVVTPSHRNPYFNMVEINAQDQLNLVCASEYGQCWRRQQAPNVFDITTVAYVADPKYVMSCDHLLEGVVRSVEVPRNRSVDIDDIDDFEYAEFLFARNKNDDPG